LTEKELKKQAEGDINLKKFLIKYYNLQTYLEANDGQYPNQKSDKVLFAWVKNTRRFYKIGALPQLRIDLLNQINFNWAGKMTYRFEERVQQLLAYKKVNRTLHVSQMCRGVNDEEYSLSRWVNEMRRKFNENRLPMEYINRLNKIGFIWNMEDVKFEKRIAALKKFHKEHGHFDVPQVGKYKKLGNWVAGLRARGVVTKRYRLWLDQIGFVWEGVRKRKRKSIDKMIEIDTKNALNKIRRKLKKDH